MVSVTGRSLNILIIEDNADMAETLSDLLQAYGYQSLIAASAEEAVERMAVEMPDLILLDLGLPDMDGMALLNKVRASSFVPLIVVSGAGGSDRIAALESGADDFITKPFSNAELIARVRALMRRIELMPQSDTRMVVGRLELDIPHRRATMRGKKIHLTPIEYALLHTLMRKAGEVVTYNDLLRAVWGDGYTGDFSVLRVNISRLRQKIEDDARDPVYILTVPGEGYQMPSSV
jgi:two-component system, OmpR family, KDP operon response regulator KdpE